MVMPSAGAALNSCRLWAALEPKTVTTLAHKLVPPWLLSTVLRAPVPTCSKTEPCVLGSELLQIDA